jgi:hypothetical protein
VTTTAGMSTAVDVTAIMSSSRVTFGLTGLLLRNGDH